MGLGWEMPCRNSYVIPKGEAKPQKTLGFELGVLWKGAGVTTAVRPLTWAKWLSFTQSSVEQLSAQTATRLQAPRAGEGKDAALRGS